jgi:hypothetical protein
MSTAQDMVVSKNRLEGSLADVPLPRLLDACLRHLVTGAIKVTAPDGRRGVLVLRAGAVDEARFGETAGDKAVAELERLRDGTYELAQRLPDLSGHLGGAAALEGSTTEVALIPIMRHCEQNALSCTIVVIGGFDRGEIVYRAGELTEVTLNGRRDDDAIVTMLGWKEAKFRVNAPPLHHEIQGWPKVGREQTQPFKLERALLAPAAGAAPEKGGLPPEQMKAQERHARRLATGTGDMPVVSATAPIEPTREAPAAAPLQRSERRGGSTLGRAVGDAFLLTAAAALVLALAALLSQA